jgi:hypothetical protein
MPFFVIFATFAGKKLLTAKIAKKRRKVREGIQNGSRLVARGGNYIVQGFNSFPQILFSTCDEQPLPR